MRCWRYRALQGAARRGTALRGSPPHAVLALHGVSRHCTASARHCPGLPRATQGCVALHTFRCWCALRCTSPRGVALRCSARDVGALQGVPRRGAVQRGGAERGGWTGAEPIVVFRTRAGGLFAIQVCPLFHHLSCPIVRGPSSRLRDHLCVQMRCPHQGSSLANGDIADIEDLPEEVSRAAASGCAEGSAAGAWVSCPSHGFVFDLRTGSNPFRPVGAREARPAFHSELYHH